MMHRLLLALLLLAGCQGGGGDGDDAARLPVQEVELILQLRDPIPGLDTWLESFERVQGADVIVRVGAGDGRPAALVEMDPTDLATALAEQRLRKPDRPLQMETELDANVWSLDEGPVAWPWRMRPFALLLREDAEMPSDWPELLRQLSERGPWGLESDAPEMNLAALCALTRAAGGNMGSVSVRNLRDEAWAEALAFMTRAVTEENRDTAATLERRFATGELSMLVADPARVRRLQTRWPGIGTKLLPFPPFEAGSGRASVFAELRVLALPANGPYPSLAAELARALLEADAQLLAGEEAQFLSVVSSSERPEEWLPLLDDVFSLPIFTNRQTWESAVGHAVEQSLERKRNPTQAILDARQSLVASTLR